MRNFWPFKRKEKLVVKVDASEILNIFFAALEEGLKRRDSRISAALKSRYGAEPIGIDAIGMPIFAEAPAPEATRSPFEPSGDAAPQSSLRPARP